MEHMGITLALGAGGLLGVYFVLIGLIAGYKPAGPLFTAAEKKFLRVLDSVARDCDARVFGKVRVADVITPKRSLFKKLENRRLYEIANKHFDFVVCDRISLEIICCVELDDSSHLRPDRVKRDKLLNRVMSEAGVVLLRVSTSSMYNKDRLQSLIHDVRTKRGEK
jgi:hypothetical protein